MVIDLDYVKTCEPLYHNKQT